MEDEKPPQLCAAIAIENIEEVIPAKWTTEAIGDFWLAMTELCTLRLVRYKPEMVKRVNDPR